MAVKKVCRYIFDIIHECDRRTDRRRHSPRCT